MPASNEHDPVIADAPTAPAAAPHMNPADFRARGGEILDFLASYLTTLESRPIRPGPDLAPGDIFRLLPPHAPDHPESWDAILADALSNSGPVVSGLTHWQHPGFFGYFPASNSFPGVLGDLLSSGLGVIGMLWATSPSCTELEMRVLDWLAEWIGLPPSFTFSGNTLAATPRPPESGLARAGGGVIQGTASEATLAALVAGRWRALNPLPTDQRRPDLVTAYTSEQSHSSVMKAAMVAGLAHDSADQRRVRHIPVDASGAMRPDALAKAITDDLNAGLVPAFVCATLGTTGTGAVDDVHAIAQAIDAAYARQPTARPRPWLHADAAYAGAAMICPEFAPLRRGLDRADSFCFNPHKWLLTNFDCDAFWTSDRRSLTASMAINPAYLQNTPPSADPADFPTVDYRDWHVPLGRRFRSLKLWFVMRHYGLEGLRAHIRHHVRLAEVFEHLVRQSPDFELAAERAFGLVCLRPRPRPGESRDRINARARRILDHVNATRKALLVHTVIPDAMTPPGHGTFVIRVSIGAPTVQERHVHDLWRLLADAAKAVS